MLKPIIENLVQCVNASAVPSALNEVALAIGERAVLDGAFGIISCIIGIPHTPFSLPYDLRAFWPGTQNAPVELNEGIRKIVATSTECAELFTTEGDVLDFSSEATEAERREIAAYVKALYKPRVYWS